MADPTFRAVRSFIGRRNGRDRSLAWRAGRALAGDRDLGHAKLAEDVVHGGLAAVPVGGRRPGHPSGPLADLPDRQRQQRRIRRVADPDLVVQHDPVGMSRIWALPVGHPPVNWDTLCLAWSLPGPPQQLTRQPTAGVNRGPNAPLRRDRSAAEAVAAGEGWRPWRGRSEGHLT